ncbi:MAG TPA: cytochrome c3 family protein [Kofleriaceae bacterium]|nr:cytochrome c3 family protein [Kofleriaceae bacterium]
MLVWAAIVGCGGPATKTAPASAPIVLPGGTGGPGAQVKTSGTYAGSQACQPCHAAIYDRWKVTPMANVVRDPRVHPDAVIPDLNKPDPVLTFGVNDIAFVYGSRWKQRYFQRIGDDLFPLPAQWDVTHRVWKPYHVADNTDWWVPFYGKDNKERPTGPLCDGCHSVNYDIRKKAPSEWNVGCEQCHGPAADHVKAPSRNNVLNPIRLDSFTANDICIQCHSQGRPLQDKIEGKVYDWPVGYRAGLPLRDFWQLEDHTLGETTFTHFADGTAHKNRMQGNDFVQSAMYAHGVRCSSCHDTHGTQHPAQLVLPADKVCGRCHSPGGPNGPRAPTLEAHTHHRAGSAGSACVACHMPKVAQTLGDVNVRSHTFKFVPPSTTEHSKVPNACTVCHADKPPAWATAALRTWDTTSPWRVAP